MPITVANWTTMSSALKEITRSGVLFLGVFLFEAGFTVNAASAIETTAAANPQSGQVQTVQLEYVEVRSLVDWGPPLVTRSTPFTKEPALDSSKVIRGTFQPGGSASNSIAFAYRTVPAGKLYLDLNHNLDLTDDPAGVFQCPKKLIQILPDIYQCPPALQNIVRQSRIAHGPQPV